MGVKPSEANGLVSSPVDRYRLPAASKSMSPPTWQQMPREAGTSRTFFSLALSRVPSVFRTKRESRLTPSNVREVGGRAALGGVAGGGVQRGCVVEVDGAVLGEVRVDADALEPLLVVGVDGELAGDAGVARRVGQAQFAVARGVQDRAVREHGQRHGLTDLRSRPWRG